MENKEKESKDKFLLRIADELIKDQEKLDELALQFSLGKAEFKAQFEQAKQDMRESMINLKESLKTSFSNQKEKLTEDLSTKIDKLEQALQHGIAETAEAYADQKHRIIAQLDELKAQIMHFGGKENLYYTFKLSAEKLKLRMRLIELHLQNERTELGKAYVQEMQHARDKIKQIKEQIKEKKAALGDAFEAYGAELRLSYEHMRKAFESLKK